MQIYKINLSLLYFPYLFTKMLFIGSHAPETDENEDSSPADVDDYKHVKTQTTVRE